MLQKYKTKKKKTKKN